MAAFDPIWPEFDNPYPDEEWDQITDFKYTDHLYLMRANKALHGATSREAQYIVAQPYRCSFKFDGTGPTQHVTVPQGMLTDLSSAPRVLRSFISRVGPHLEASILHDFLFIAWLSVEGRGARKDDFKFANKLMREAMKRTRMNKRQAGLVYRTVKNFGWGIYKSDDGGFHYVEVP